MKVRKRPNAQKLGKVPPNPIWPGLWPEIADGQKIFSMARGVLIWPNLKNLAIKLPGWQHCLRVVSLKEDTPRVVSSEYNCELSITQSSNHISA